MPRKAITMALSQAEEARSALAALARSRTMSSNFISRTVPVRLMSR
jgi:hypothetical protein